MERQDHTLDRFIRLCQRKFGGSHLVQPSSYLAIRCFSSVSNGRYYVHSNGR